MHNRGIFFGFVDCCDNHKVIGILCKLFLVRRGACHSACTNSSFKIESFLQPSVIIIAVIKCPGRKPLEI